MLLSDRRIDVIIAIPQDEKRTKCTLPSWVPAWRAPELLMCPSPISITKTRRADGQVNICAGGSQSPQPSIKECDRILFAKGFKLDSIRSLGVKYTIDFPSHDSMQTMQ
ncbi:hypothetical protein ONS96_014951 [Cadophora gregata f. sp. sojae]|nr:hypothetical protein ONS96_014951 [Cadophora gregata f. sp. sojae]